ncbi:MAG: DUF3592 domain-containing protein [Chloroflexaceae bacterium]|nr:DUF3592 domain-containing protein [Chloroflexaceae bacterium]
MTTQPIPEEYFTPDGVFVLKPDYREVAMGLKPYRIKGQGCAFFILLFPLTFFLIGLVVSCGLLLPSAVGEWNSYFRLREQQATTTAQVVDKNSRRDDDSTTYYITYAFTHPDPNGEPQQYTNEVSVSAGEYGRLDRGQAITVYFVPDDPTISQATPPAISDPIKVSLFSLLWAGFWLSISGFMTFVGFHSIRRDDHLTKHGQLLHGTLTHIKGDTDSDNDYMVKARYQFESPLGIPLEGKDEATRNHLKSYSLPPLGTPVAVWYADDTNYTLL